MNKLDIRFQSTSLMAARVEYRLGSIFDEPCDLLVIALSVAGTMSPGLQEQIRKAGLPLPHPYPHPVPWGTITVYRSDNPRYGNVAYAAAVSGQSSSMGIVEAIGQGLGRFVKEEPIVRSSAPPIGEGYGDLTSETSAAALRRGFLTTAPDSAILVINVRSPHTFKALTGTSSRPDAAERRIPSTLATAPAPRAAPLTPAAKSKRTRVFISYSHADADWLERLQKHLRPLIRTGIEVWDDRRLRPGEPWREEIQKALAETKVAVLLVSADFLASDFIVTDELPPLLKAAKEDGATILPVIVSPCRFERTESLSRFQAVNDPRNPLIQMRRANREKVLDRLACAVEDALKQ